jgi:diamine N-acetyltransferase
MGIGSAILGWMADEAAPAARNLWVSASDFNKRAIAFYERPDFSRVHRPGPCCA